MALPDKFRLVSPHYVEREIEGVSYRFYQCSVRTSSRLADLVSEITGHLSVLMHSTDRDTGSTHEEITDQSGTIIKRTEVQPINPDLLTVRIAKRERAVQGAIKSIADPKYRMVIGELLMDSLRDDFPRGKPRNSQDIQGLVEEMDISVLGEFLKGLAAANAKVFGELGKAVRDALGTQLGAVLKDQVAPATAG